MILANPVGRLHRVGKVVEKRLRHLGIETARDLLFFYPFRYEDFSRVVPIGELEPGEQVTVRGGLELIANKRSARKRTIVTEGILSDGTGQIRLVWFGQPYLTKNLQGGDAISVSGIVAEDMFGLVIKSPSYEKQKLETTHTARLVPIYPSTAGITQKQLRFLVQQCIPGVGEVAEWIPDEIRKEAGIIGIAQALHDIHFPKDQDALDAALKRLKFDELFILQLRGELVRREAARISSPEIPFRKEEIQQFVQSLPFPLTPDQKQAAWDILKDIGGSVSMNRLLEGDVGSGKTVVAAIAAHNSALNGYQVAILAPTEILAKQHFASFSRYLSPHHTIGLLTASACEIVGTVLEGRGRAAQKRDFLTRLEVGEIDVIVGTHALLSEGVSFHNLGLVVVDEQHRFGVEQRKGLREKSGMKHLAPHFLSMSATPIPRSFALALYGDLDLSVIETMPPGRKEIATRFVAPQNRTKAYQFIRTHVKMGEQVFVVCPTIGGDVVGDKKAVVLEYEKLSKEIFPDLRVGFLHGKMKVTDKDAVMQAFQNKEMDILVSTSVIEVGVDIPNATIMMIEGAEGFGLAQLHQFRGRVGRSDKQSYCFLFSDSQSESMAKRLSFFEKNMSGFKVAEYDLETRGPGEVYGTAQSGMMHLRLATLHDAALIKLARESARQVDFTLYPSLLEKVEEWEKNVHLE